jgi:hypothetical protein
MRMLLRMNLVLTFRVFLVGISPGALQSWQTRQEHNHRRPAAAALFVTDTAVAAVAACGMCVD